MAWFELLSRQILNLGGMHKHRLGGPDETINPNIWVHASQQENE
jgi:hypothetical protein